MTEIRVLIVDDNRGYREAFRRNLILRGYDVTEAEDGAQALELLQTSEPDVVVTDLAMRHATEGLDLIRQARALRPRLPIIMISAVGTFDEGAEAMRLGAWRVISKSRIDEEIGNLFTAIEDAARQHEASRGHSAEAAALLTGAAGDRPRAIAGLNELLRRADVSQSLKGEIYDMLAGLAGDEESGGTGLESPKNPPAPTSTEPLEKVDQILAGEIERFDTLDADTRQNLRTAEFLYQQSRNSRSEIDFNRSMGFAFCFAVENEVKLRLRKRLQKFFADPATPPLVRGLLEKNGRSISIFYQQHLLRAQRGMENEATIENFFHTFQRILEHEGRYKPDGLKALGIVLICFGRAHTFRMMNTEVPIDNPLGLRGFDTPAEVMRFASLLINLQHYRNPYIHPELSEMTKLSHIRETAFDCLNMIVRIQ